MAKTTKQAAVPVAMNTEELQAAIATKQTDLLGYKKGLAAGELKNPSIIASTRKEIARLKTALTMESVSKEGEK